MTNIFSIGVSHKTAPLEVREKFYLTALQQDIVLSELKSNPAVLAAFVLSTCNRTEIYLHTLEDFSPAKKIIPLLAQTKKIKDPAVYHQFFYTYGDRQAVEHLLRVSTGLDSLVIGEKQILGQVKEAVERAREKAMLNKQFNILTNTAIRAGKKSQTETQIGFGGSSVSWAAIRKAEELFGTLRDKTILVIGAGEMSDLAVGHIQNKGFKKLFLMNRTHANAQELADKYGAEAVGFCDIKEILSQVDICICSSGAPHYVLEKETLQRVMPLRNEKPLILIDISMPRNIDPAVSEISNVRLYEIDDLKEVVDANMKIREKAVDQVEKIIADKLIEYYTKAGQSQPVSLAGP